VTHYAYFIDGERVTAFVEDKCLPICGDEVDLQGKKYCVWKRTWYRFDLGHKVQIHLHKGSVSYHAPRGA